MERFFRAPICALFDNLTHPAILQKNLKNQKNIL